MAGMVDLAVTPKEAAEKMASDMPMAMPNPGNMPKYPWGTCLRLGNEELKKLGMDGGCTVGDILTGRILAKVTSCREEQRADGDTECNVELQITAMSLGDDGAPEKARTERRTKRYGEDAAEGGDDDED